MTSSYAPNVLMVFATYKPFQSLATDIAWLVEESLDRLFKPIAAPIVNSVIFAGRLDGTWTRDLKFNKRNWERMQQYLLSGDFSNFNGIWVVEKGEHVLKDQDFEVSVQGFSDSPVLIGIALSRSIIGDLPALGWQDHWVNLGHEIFCRFDCATGYLTLDNERLTNYVTPYEREREISWPANLTHLHDQLRGYYWGNWLSAGHIQRLGGIASIKANAPCFRVLRPEGCQQEGAFLQLTPDLYDFSDKALRDLRFYFGELLPQYDQPLIWSSYTTKYRLAYDGEQAGWAGNLIMYDKLQP